MEDEGCSTQLIDGDGMFNMAGLEGFTKAVKLGECGLSYAVVSIMGPQSSGKSTLLNQLFKTNFREMDAFRGRSQTTKGIWIAKCRGIEPCTIVMDLEGTDGRERGEDDTTFEKQSSLFALAVSDIVLINMWCHDIGREQAANKPLLKTVFQVMMRLFSPRRTTLLFVIRDKTKTPLEHLEPVLREDIQKIWDGVSKPEAHKSTPLSDFFNVEVTALPSYEEKEEQFRDQVAQLRQRFCQSIAPGGLAGDRRGVIPASGFSFSAQQMWKVIKENKDLDLPAHKVMVATVRCEEIANEKLSHLASDESWLDLEQAVLSGPVLGFGKSLAAILDAHFSEYDAETAFFDEGVRTAKRQQLESRALHMVNPAYHMMLGHLRSKALDSFKKELELSLKKGEGFTVSLHQCTESSLHEFDLASEDLVLKQADWNPSKVREKLVRDIDTHAASVCAEKLAELVTHFENQLSNSLDEPVESLLEAAGLDTWPSVRKIFRRETDDSILGFSKSLVGFKLDDKTQSKMIENLKNFARGIVEKRAKEEAGKILIKMKDRFSSVFSHDKDSMPRVWTGKEDIRVITKDARAAALKLLAVMAAIRLDERQDKVESILFLNLLDTNAAREKKGEGFADPLASSTWEGIPSKDTLITPVQCKQTWRRLNAETEYTVAQAMSAQEANKRNSNWLPPPWAIIALGILGFNEFMMLLKNPFYIMAIFTVFLVAKALWVQLDVAAEFQHGMLPGVIAISARLIPTIMNILKKLAEEGNQPPPSPANQQPASPRPPPPPPRLPERLPGLHRSPLSFKGDSPRRTPRSYSMPVASPLASTLSSLDGSRKQMNPFMDSEFDKSDAASSL